MYCTEFYLCGVSYLNTELKVCCTHTSLSGRLTSDSVMVLCEMSSALVGQDRSWGRLGYSYGHPIHSCPLPKCKRSWKTRKVSIYTEQWSSCKALESQVKLLQCWKFAQWPPLLPVSYLPPACLQQCKWGIASVWKNTGWRERNVEQKMFRPVLSAKALYW